MEFSFAIPIGGIAAALITGNAVLFKPAPEAEFVGALIRDIIAQSSLPDGAFQFIPCQETGLGQALLKDSRCNTVVLTGSTETACAFYRERPDMHLVAETGGKNSIIVTAMADRELAIHHIVESAFGYAGQKCSAASLLILESEVYDDPVFRKRLLDATESLVVGEAHEPLYRCSATNRVPKSRNQNCYGRT